MIGRTLKHYRVEDLLGKGGMGVVYRARDVRLDRPVALKILPPDVTSDPERRRRFFLEARAASAVNHPAIAQIYDVDESEDGVFIAMELVEGRTVRELVIDRELDVLGALEIAVQVAQGLGKAHEAGIVHRDIKSDNLKVTPDGHAKILDFGLAKLLEPPGTGGDGKSASLLATRTQAGMVLGTLGYMSPEQARAQKVDHRTDLFSLGVVLYEMVTGQLPFAGSSPIDTMHAIAYEESRPVTQIRSNLPASLQRVVSRCLRKRPEDRYADAKEIVSDLRMVQREIESGISQAIPLRDRIMEGFRSLRQMSAAEWVWPLTIVIGLVLVSFFAFRGGEDSVPGFLFLGLMGLFIWRRLRNRRRRLVKRFATKVRKMTEVRLVALDGNRATVVVDRAVAKTYVRVNSLMDSVNSKMFFGEPFSVVVRDDVTPEEVAGLLRGPGVIYVRPDVVEADS